ncbi:MAG: peptidoglycan bridge formation glycyltransferase FemA/FemB family protein [Bacteroidia bacterium]|nr:peptidoglycan bridge formation glycyltransferase FemA/FemB family protein [Bacteroidia bacterium]
MNEAMMSMIKIDREQWELYWPKVCHAPLLQSYEYGEAKRQAQRCRVCRFLLHSEQAGPVGLLQVLVYSLPLIGGVARINRGPVFFADDFRMPLSRGIATGIMTAVCNTLRQERWRLLRIVPELYCGADDTSVVLEDVGFKKRHTSPVVSAVIDLARSPSEIRAGFHGKWRNSLNKSEKAGLELEAPSLDDALPFLISKYEEMQQQKCFNGVPTKLIHAMANQQGQCWNFSILFARYNNIRQGAVLTVRHGDTCTYLVGWNSDEGRRLQVNYFLLWHSMIMQREWGCKYFDVGGLGANTTTGVERFKKRLEGQEYSLIGEYSYTDLPFVK